MGTDEHKWVLAMQGYGDLWVFWSQDPRGLRLSIPYISILGALAFSVNGSSAYQVLKLMFPVAPSNGPG